MCQCRILTRVSFLACPPETDGFCFCSSLRAVYLCLGMLGRGCPAPPRAAEALASTLPSGRLLFLSSPRGGRSLGGPWEPEGFRHSPSSLKAFALDEKKKKSPGSEQGFVSVCCEEDSLWVPYLSLSFSRTSSRKELASKRSLPLCLEVPDCLASSHSVSRILQNSSRCFLWLLSWQPPLPSVLFQS